VNAVVAGPAMVRDIGAARRLCGDAACDLVTLLPGSHRRDEGVLAVVGPGPGDGAGLEVAARVWMSRHGSGQPSDRPLGLIAESDSDRGRVRRLGERLHSLGVADVSVDGAVAGDPLVVRSWQPDGRLPTGTPLVAGPVALVYSSEDPQRVGIDQRLVRLDQARRLRTPALGVAATPGTSAGAEQ